MASRNAQLADAVTTALNTAAAANAFNRTFTAKRLAVPVNDLAALKTLTVTVISASDHSDQVTRDADEHEMIVFVGVEKVLTSPDPTVPAANAEVDTLMELVEQISDFFGPTTISESIGFFINSTIRVLSDPPSMLTQNLFRGVIEATFMRVV